MSDLLALCRAQCARYPLLAAQDLVKALYQATFGCGHLVADPAAARARLIEEAEQAARSPAVPAPVEPLGARFCRVHLRALPDIGLSADTLFRLFERSARTSGDGMDAFLARLDALARWIDDGTLSLDAAASRAFLTAYRAAGCPATHHSDAFRLVYAPAYRVIDASYVPFLGVFAAIDRLLAADRPVIVAIEGGSAAGKSSLAARLQGIYGCNVFHMDDFFLRPHQRTPERFAQPGGNVDVERFAAEVLCPLQSGKPFSYRPFDCHTMGFLPPVPVQPHRLSVVEGVYSMHPALAGAYDCSVFLGIDAETQRARILARNGEQMLARFLSEWIPLENAYFAHTQAASRCSLRLPAN